MPHWGFTLGRFQEFFPRLKEYAINNFLVSNTHIWLTKTENFTKKMRFVLMFKMGDLGTSREHYPPDVTLRTLEDILGTFLQKSKAIKQLTRYSVLGTQLVK